MLPSLLWQQARRKTQTEELISKMKTDSIPQAGSDCQERLVNGSFTPGPWKADGYTVRQSGQRGTRMIADVCYTGPHHTPPDEYPKICRIADEANARLIAAAPDLLAALQNLENDDGSIPAHAWNLCQAAISKAIPSANVADQTPAALDSANTTGSSSRLAASVLFVLGCSWWFLL